MESVDYAKYSSLIDYLDLRYWSVRSNKVDMRKTEKMSVNVYEENFNFSKVAENNQDYLMR